MSDAAMDPRLRFLNRTYDFYDFGCSAGARIESTNAVFPDLRGLGIDIAAPKVAAARENGHDAVVFDILKLPEQKSVDFVTMTHFLEHLPGLAMAHRMIAKAISVSRDSVMIRQPWFDADGELARRGFKFYWSHWRGHPNKMTTLDFYSILQEELELGRIRRFSIYGRKPVHNSGDPSIIPLGAPKDQRRYDANKHGPKSVEMLPCPAFKEIVVRVNIGEGGKADMLQARIAPLELVFDSCGDSQQPLQSPEFSRHQ